MNEDRQPTSRQPSAPWTAAELRQFAGVSVSVRLNDDTTWTGRLRTDLLTERSLSVYIIGHGEEGATLYIDQIAEIVPIHVSADD